MSDQPRQNIQPWKMHAHNPFRANCPPHLRRICGACKHFTGRTIRSIGNCERGHGANFSGATIPVCDEWERRDAR